MSGRVVPLGVALLSLVLGAGLVGAIIASCYNLPEPQCGFICGPNGACPSDYTCAADHHCHKNGAPDSLVCGTPDAAVDGPPDAPLDAPMIDAPNTDAAVDAPID